MNSDKFDALIERTTDRVNSLDARSVTDFSGMITHLKEIYSDFQKGGEALIKEGDVLKIGIVGQVKAGKSSFLNSLFFDGDTILPKASTPMTAGLTVLEYSDNNEFEVDYYTAKEWDEFRSQDEAYKLVEKSVL